jgi:imidazolonepropionase-like amidohydrolase
MSPFRLLACLLLFMSPAVIADTLVHAGRLIDGVNDEVMTERTIVIAQGRITAVEKGYREATANDVVIDLRNHTVLPGLIDLHTHLSNEMSRDNYIREFTDNTGDIAFRMPKYAEITLMAGFTTVRDLGDSDNLTVALRDAIARGDITGPRIFTAAKSIATTGGHADPTNGYRDDLMGDPGPRDGVVNSAADAYQAVRQRYKDGADLIKITATGGVLSTAKSGQNPQFTDEEVAAIVAAAKDYGFHVAAHAHGKEGMLRAINAGVRTIEHGTHMDSDVMRAMRRQGTYYVPTITAGKWVAMKAEEPGFFPEIVRPKAAAIGPQIQETFRKAYASGVKIAFGTDSAVSPHGENAKEFAYMVEAGMPPMEAIQSATSVAAEVLDGSDAFGSIRPGRFADLVAVDGDPLADIAELQDIAFVMKEGRVYKPVE